MLPDDYARTLRHRQTGQLLCDAMREFGMGTDPDRIADSKIDPSRYAAFVEMHIEQGRYLLDEGLPLAVGQRRRRHQAVLHHDPRRTGACGRHGDEGPPRRHGGGRRRRL